MSASQRTSLFRTKLAHQLLKQSKGFTLIELLVVIVIVGVLSAVAVPTFLNQVRRSRAAEGESTLATIASGVTVYAFDCGAYDPALGALETGEDCTGGTAVEGPWVEAAFTNLAPNYDDAGLTLNSADTAVGTTLQIVGDAGGAYDGINCQKGVGAEVSADDGCTLP